MCMLSFITCMWFVKYLYKLIDHTALWISEGSLWLYDTMHNTPGISDRTTHRNTDAMWRYFMWPDFSKLFLWKGKVSPQKITAMCKTVRNANSVKI